MTEGADGTGAPRHGIVLSGGGADGAFAVGVLKALFSGLSPATDLRPLEAEVFSGTSIGSFNAAYLVGRDAHGNAGLAADDLAEIWLDELGEDASTCHNGAYRLRGDPLELLSPACYRTGPFAPLLSLARDGADLLEDATLRVVRAVRGKGTALQRIIQLFNFASFVSREPWEKTLRKTIDYRSIRRSSKALRVAATNWATGDLKVYDNAAMTDQMGPEIIAASSAIPGFYPPAKVGSQPFVDGSVLLNTPLRPAIRAGASVLHVVYLDPDIANIPLAQLQNTLETLYRMQQISWAASIKRDIAAAARINRVLRGLRRNEEISATAEFRDLAAEYSRFSPLTVHCYFPRDDFGGALGLLDLRRDRLRQLMQIGYDIAERHDCRQAGCVLPTPE